MLLLDQQAFTCSPAHLGLGRAVNSRQNPSPRAGAAAQWENTNALTSKRAVSLSARESKWSLGYSVSNRRKVTVTMGLYVPGGGRYEIRGILPWVTALVRI